MGTVDETGVIRLDFVRGETIAETTSVYDDQTTQNEGDILTTDEGNAFNAIVDYRLASHHMTVKHKGTFDKDGVMCYFTNPETGASSNAIEGMFGVAQRNLMRHSTAARSEDALTKQFTFLTSMLNRTNCRQTVKFVNFLTFLPIVCPFNMNPLKK